MQMTLVALLPALLATAPALAAERSFPVSSFEAIVVSAPSNVDIRTGQAPSVVAIGKPEDLDRLDIRVIDSRLVIGTKKGRSRGWSRNGMTIRVTAGSLAGAAISGSGDMTIDTIEGPFSGRISGSGDMQIASLKSPVLALAISGSGNITAAGSCGDASLSISGSGSIRASEVRCQRAKASISGSGNISLTATETSDLRITGSGNIQANGGGRCTTRTTGSGTTRCN